MTGLLWLSEKSVTVEGTSILQDTNFTQTKYWEGTQIRRVKHTASKFVRSHCSWPSLVVPGEMARAVLQAGNAELLCFSTIPHRLEQEGKKKQRWEVCSVGWVSWCWRQSSPGHALQDVNQNPSPGALWQEQLPCPVAGLLLALRHFSQWFQWGISPPLQWITI